jgi:hypothetical protein
MLRLVTVGTLGFVNLNEIANTIDRQENCTKLFKQEYAKANKSFLDEDFKNAFIQYKDLISFGCNFTYNNYAYLTEKYFEYNRDKKAAAEKEDIEKKVCLSFENLSNSRLTDSKIESFETLTSNMELILLNQNNFPQAKVDYNNVKQKICNSLKMLYEDENYKDYAVRVSQNLEKINPTYDGIKSITEILADWYYINNLDNSRELENIREKYPNTKAAKKAKKQLAILYERDRKSAEEFARSPMGKYIKAQVKNAYYNQAAQIEDTQNQMKQLGLDGAAQGLEETKKMMIKSGDQYGD